MTLTYGAENGTTLFCYEFINTVRIEEKTVGSGLAIRLAMTVNEAVHQSGLLAMGLEPL